MADIFHEVDEEVRRERLKQLWDRFGVYIIALAVLVVIGIGAWRGYEWYIAKQAAAAGAQFEHAVQLGEQGKQAEAEAAFDKLAAQAPPGYRALASFRAAAALVKSKPDQAVKAYDKLATDPSISPTLQDLAAVRAAMLRLDTASLDDMRRRLEAQIEGNRPFRYTARELLALSAWQHHDYAAAKKYIDMIIGDPGSPPLMRSRAEMLAAMIAANSKTSGKS